jgi:16S rRNA processing protein RimM
MAPQNFVALGYISGIYGVRGWVKVFSYTQPREQILEYKHWHLGDQAQPEAVALEAGRSHGKGIVAKLAGVEDRDAAAALIDQAISIPRDALPEPEPGEYYWADLAGLAVRDRQGQMLGTVDHLLETGAHDVLVLAEGANRMIPFVQGKTVLEVDLDAGVITVDWDAAWWE